MSDKINLLFGTRNMDKVKELKEQLPESINLIDMRSAGITKELKETKKTIKGNALQKLEQLLELYPFNCISEDTGLCVPALGGDPGVRSARYAGPDKNDEENIQKLLQNIVGKERDAFFLTIIALAWEGKIYTFQGKCHGKILPKKIGTHGFGYDPIFQPTGYDISFAQMPLSEKTKISHRGKAVSKLIAFLSESVKKSPS